MLIGLYSKDVLNIYIVQKYTIAAHNSRSGIYTYFKLQLATNLFGFRCRLAGYQRYQLDLSNNNFKFEKTTLHPGANLLFDLTFRVIARSGFYQA